MSSLTQETLLASQQLANVYRTELLHSTIRSHFASLHRQYHIFHFISLQYNGLICLIVASYIASYIAVFVSKIIVQSRAISQVSQPAIVVLLTQRNVNQHCQLASQPRIAAQQHSRNHYTQRNDLISVVSTTQPMPTSLLSQQRSLCQLAYFSSTVSF